MKRDWKKVRKEVKEFVENEVYPAEEVLHKRDDESAKKMQELMQKAKDNSLWGKILQININGKDSKILAKGLRNTQGGDYYEKGKILITTKK